MASFPYAQSLAEPRRVVFVPLKEAGRVALDVDTGLFLVPIESGHLLFIDMDETDASPNEPWEQGTKFHDRFQPPAKLSEPFVCGKGIVYAIDNLDHPRGVVVLRPEKDTPTNSLRVAISENGGNCVSVYTVDPFQGTHELKLKMGGPANGNTPDKFHYPQDIKVMYDASGKELLLVADGPNDRIKVCDSSTGEMLHSCDCKWPWGLAVRIHPETNEQTLCATIGKEIDEFSLTTFEKLRTIASDTQDSWCATDSNGNLFYSRTKTTVADVVEVAAEQQTAVDDSLELTMLYSASTQDHGSSTVFNCPLLNRFTNGMVIDEVRGRLIICGTLHATLDRGAGLTGLCAFSAETNAIVSTKYSQAARAPCKHRTFQQWQEYNCRMPQLWSSMTTTIISLLQILP